MREVSQLRERGVMVMREVFGCVGTCDSWQEL